MICPGSPFPRHLPPPSPSNSRRSRLSSSSKTSKRTNDSNSSGRSTITYRTHTTSTHGIFGKKTKEQFECSFERWDFYLYFHLYLYLYTSPIAPTPPQPTASLARRQKRISSVLLKGGICICIFICICSLSAHLRGDISRFQDPITQKLQTNTISCQNWQK